MKTKKPFEKFEISYFKSLDKEPLVTDDINLVRDTITRLEEWDYPEIDEVNMIVGYYPDGDFDMIWTSEEGELISL